MSQQTPQERNLQPIPAWMLKDEEKTGGDAGRVVEETPSPAQTQEPEKTTIPLPERKAVVPSPKPPVLSREEVQQSALGKDVLWVAILGAILGGVVGHAIEGGGVLGTVGGGSIGAVVCGVIAHILPEDERELLLKGLGWLDCCLTSVVLVVASVVTIAGFLLWHSLLLSALAGGSIMTMMLIVLSIAASSYKAGSQSS
jgi:hypothetical protein